MDIMIMFCHISLITIEKHYTMCYNLSERNYYNKTPLLTRIMRLKGLKMLIESINE